MKKVLAIAACLGILCLAGSAGAVILTFEDLSGQGALPTNYQGLTWDSNWRYYESSHPPYNPSSGVERIYTHNFGGWVNFGTQVTFQGSWVASYDIGQDMYWEGYRSGVKIFESSHLSGGAQTYINVNWAGVDYVKFVSTSYNYFIIDDIKFNPVPLPGAAWLLGSGLLGLVGLRRKFKK